MKHLAFVVPCLLALAFGCPHAASWAQDLSATETVVDEQLSAHLSHTVKVILEEPSLDRRRWLTDDLYAQARNIARDGQADRVSDRAILDI